MDPLLSAENLNSTALSAAASHCNGIVAFPPVLLLRPSPKPHQRPMFPAAHDANRLHPRRPSPVAALPPRSLPDLEDSLLRLKRANLYAARSVATLRLAQMEERAMLLRVASIRAAAKSAVAAAAAAADEEEEVRQRRRAEMTRTMMMLRPRDSGAVTSIGRGGCGCGRSTFALPPGETRSICGGPDFYASFSDKIAPASDWTQYSDVGSTGSAEAVPRSTSQLLQEAEGAVALLRERRRVEQSGGLGAVVPLGRSGLSGTAIELQSPNIAGESSVAFRDCAKECLDAVDSVTSGGAATKQSIALSSDDGAKAKRKTRKPPKKGKDRKPHKRKPIDMPRRALSAYNLFFAEERKRIIRESAGQGSEEKEEDDDDGDEDNVLCPDMTRTIARSRLHRKSHGRVGFRDLTKIIAARWKNLSPDQMERYNHLAAEDARRHKEAMKAYYARKQRNMATSSSAGSDK